MNTKHIIKNLGLGFAFVAALTCGSQLLANEIASYSSLAGDAINFNGSGNFSFSSNGTPASNIQINVEGGAFTGDLTGNFTIGTITTIPGSGPPFNVPSESYASVTGSGTLEIYNGVLPALTASITWDDIVQQGTGSTLDDLGVVDLTSVHYTGSNADLLVLANAGIAVNTLDFTFTPAVTLTNLANSANSTTYSGTISTSTAVPDTASTAFLILLGGAGIVLGLVAQRRKSTAV